MHAARAQPKVARTPSIGSDRAPSRTHAVALPPLFLLAALPLLAISGCAASQRILPDATPEYVLEVLDASLWPGPDLASYRPLEMENDGPSTVVRRTRSGAFAFLPPVVTLGMWIVCPVHYRVEVTPDPVGTLISVRVLQHHQVLLALPVVFSDDEAEEQLLDWIERALAERGLRPGSK